LAGYRFYEFPTNDVGVLPVCRKLKKIFIFEHHAFA